MRPPLHFMLGALALASCILCLGLRIEPVFTYFYSFVWWSYIVFVDGWVYWKKGNSLLRSRPWELAVLAFWSVAAWNVYEIFNLLLQNWYYINTPVDPWVGRAHGYIAFATVLPGVFETTELLEAHGRFSGLRMRPRRITPAFLVGHFLFGCAVLTAVLAWPHVFFPLTWAVVVLLLEPFVYWSGGPSILRDFERGEPGRFLRLLAAGLVTGGLWESWNFWTRTKWIYTVPGFEELKLFEMPVLGFLGFPPFVVECFVMAAFLGIFRGNRGWEEKQCRVGGGARMAVTALGMCAAILFNELTFRCVETYTVSSRDRSVAALPLVEPNEAQRLINAGLRRPIDVLLAAQRGNNATVATQLGIAPERFHQIATLAAWSEAKGLGADNLRLLAAIGIDSPQSLARANAAALTDALATQARATGMRRPYEREVTVWIRAARGLGQSRNSSGSVSARVSP